MVNTTTWVSTVWRQTVSSCTKQPRSTREAVSSCILTRTTWPSWRLLRTSINKNITSLRDTVQTIGPTTWCTEAWVPGRDTIHSKKMTQWSACMRREHLDQPSATDSDSTTCTSTRKDWSGKTKIGSSSCQLSAKRFPMLKRESKSLLSHRTLILCCVFSKLLIGVRRLFTTSLWEMEDGNMRMIPFSLK